MVETQTKCKTCRGVGYPTCRSCNGMKLVPISFPDTFGAVHATPCPDCGGHGAFICPTCKGRGTVKGEKN